MNIELKNVKVHKQLSQETICFTASIYLDGKRVGAVENRGTGGSHFYRWDDRETGRRIEEWADKQPAAFDFEKLDQIVDALMERAELKKLCRKKTVFRLKDTAAGEWLTLDRSFSPEVKAHIISEFGERLESIANEQL